MFQPPSAGNEGSVHADGRARTAALGAGLLARLRSFAIREVQRAPVANGARDALCARPFAPVGERILGPSADIELAIDDRAEEGLLLEAQRRVAVTLAREGNRSFLAVLR